MKRLNKNTLFWLNSLIAITIFGLFLSSCGSWRTASINGKDDKYNEHLQQGVRSHTLAVDNQELDLMHKEQAGKILTGANDQPTPNGGLVDGIAINKYFQTDVRFVVLLGNTVILDQVVEHRKTIPVKLPINASGYTLIYYEDGARGETEHGRGSFTVTNLKNKNYDGASYYFILRSGMKIGL